MSRIFYMKCIASVTLEPVLFVDDVLVMKLMGCANNFKITSGCFHAGSLSVVSYIYISVILKQQYSLNTI